MHIYTPPGPGGTGSGSVVAVVRRGGGPARAWRIPLAALLCALLGLTAFTFGEGTTNRALQLLDGGVWVSDGDAGTATHINVAAARADAALNAVPAGVAVVEVINVDGDLVAIGSDGAAYFISTADGTAAAASVMLHGQQVYAGRDWVYLIDHATGSVAARPLGTGGDPRQTTLQPPIGSVAVDGADRLHALLPDRSAVAVVAPGTGDVEQIGLQATDRARLTRTGQGVAAIDPGRGTLTDLATGKTRRIPAIDGDITTTGSPDWVIAVAGTRMIGVNLRHGGTIALDLPAPVSSTPGTSNRPVSILGGRAYILDQHGKVHPVTLADGTIGTPLTITTGTIGELITAAGGIILNDPNGPGALVLGNDGKTTPVNKGNAAAGTPPPPPPPPPATTAPNRPNPGGQGTAAPAPVPDPAPGTEQPPADPCVTGQRVCTYRPIVGLSGYVTSPGNTVTLIWSYGAGDTDPTDLRITPIGSVGGGARTTQTDLPPPADGESGTYCVEAHQPLPTGMYSQQCVTVEGRPATKPIVGLTGFLSGDTVTLTWSYGAGKTDPQQMSIKISGALVWYEFAVPTSKSGLRAPAAGQSETYCLTAFHGARGDYSTECVTVQGPPLAEVPPAVEPPNQPNP